MGEYAGIHGAPSEVSSNVGIIGLSMFLEKDTFGGQILVLLQHLAKTEKYRVGSPGGSVVKNLCVVQGTRETSVPSLGWEDPLEKEGNGSPL